MRDPSCDFSYRKLKELRFQINFNVFATGIWNSKVKFPFFLKMNNFSMQHPSGRIVKFAPFSKKKFAHSFTFDQYLYYIYNIYRFSSPFYESYRRSRTFDLPSFCKIRFPNMLHIGGSLRVGKAGGTHALFFKERGPLPLLLFRLSGRGLGVTHRCS